MYYIIERDYVGPNQDQDQYADSHYVLIQSEPGRTNSSNEPRIAGWLGTTNDWCESAHGEYETLEEAREAIATEFGEVREASPTFEDPDTIVAIYKVGRYEPMSSQETAEWAYDGVQSDVDAETTDERIAELLAEYEASANDQGYTLDLTALRVLMEELRDELEDEIE